MHVQNHHFAKLRGFIQTRNFRDGLLALDLDGTALLEERGKVFISSAVEKGVQAIYALGLPIALNTLRFPLSVITTIGDAWCQMASSPIPTVLLNGSLLGCLHRVNSHVEYEAWSAFPMTASEIDALIHGISELFDGGIHEMLLFYYPLDWRAGETLWTSQSARIPLLQAKYVSASNVISGSIERLRESLLQQPVCMASLLIDRPEDVLMAYQHNKPNSFFTHKGVDKAFGLREMAKRLKVSLVDSLGAGDTRMDTFLSEVGFAVIVGESELPFEGQVETIRVADPLALGELITEAAMLAARRNEPGG